MVCKTWLVGAILLGLGLMIPAAACSQEKQADPAAEDASSPHDRFAAPKADDVAALTKFLQEMMSFRPNSRDELTEYRTRAPQAMKQAAERILKLEKDKTSTGYKLAQKLLLQFKLQPTAIDGSAEENRKLLGELLTVVEDSKASVDSLQLAMTYTGMLEYKHPDVAKEAYEKLSKLLADSEEPTAVKVREMLAGSLRRLNLPGNPLELKGTTVDGKPFDITSLKGKVVLIDFWATWCGPCLAEQPNLKRNYELYKDKGFEIVGVSIDEDREALDTFLENERTPWITLHDKGGWEHPALQKYGINGIPAMFLLDKQGKVVSTKARGEELNRLLAEQFGEK